MKIKLTLFFALILLGIGAASAQNLMKLAGKVHQGPAEVAPGITVQAGDLIELHEGLAPEGFRHIYTSRNMAVEPLGYGANYDTYPIQEIRYNAKQDAYMVFMKVSASVYFVDLDKGLKSGEIKRVIAKEEGHD